MEIKKRRGFKVVLRILITAFLWWLDGYTRKITKYSKILLLLETRYKIIGKFKPV